MKAPSWQTHWVSANRRRGGPDNNYPLMSYKFLRFDSTRRGKRYLISCRRLGIAGYFLNPPFAALVSTTPAAQKIAHGVGCWLGKLKCVAPGDAHLLGQENGCRVKHC